VIFGAYGALAGIWALVVIFFGNPMLKLMGNSPQVQIQTDMQSEMMPYTIFGTVLSIILTILIINAGVLLLKKRKNALKWSNIYAYASIGMKIINLLISIVWIAPMTKEMMSTVSAGSAGGTFGAFGPVMIISMVVGFLVTLIYPVLTLVLLNRPPIKTWFANQPS
jgi:hypothetical protein